MNEIDRLQRFRATMPAPGPAAVRAARQRVFAAPARRSQARRLLVPIGSAATLAAIAVALIVAQSASSPNEAEAAADRALHAAGAAAAAQPAPEIPGPGQFLYVRSRDAYLDMTGSAVAVAAEGTKPAAAAPGYAVLIPHEREIWLARDGSLKIRQRTVGEPVFPRPSDRAAWIAAGSPDLSGARDMDIEEQSGYDPFAEPLALPSDVDALDDLVRDRARQHSAKQNSSDLAPYSFTQIGDLLRERALPPDVRSAVYEVATRIDGVELVTQADGTVTVGILDHGIERTITFDPRTGALLAESDIVASRDNDMLPGAAPGTVAGRAEHLSWGVVDSTGETVPVP